ncbi:MAG: hypothetical protein LC754_15170 [Acidobacteria bacterium]|nr:hypothetical protein [Acidobacteriota bacterium]
MNTTPFSNAPVRRMPSLLLLVLFAGLFSASLINSSADVAVNQRPAAPGGNVTPAGSLLMDSTTRQPAVGALPVNFVRSPDAGGPGGRGRYLVAVNSGYGVQFNAATNRAQQSLSITDLNARPEPVVVQNVYFPAPQSANVGAVFAPRAEPDGSYVLYVSGGLSPTIWTTASASSANCAERASSNALN